MQGRTGVAASGAAQHGRPPAPGQPLRPSVVIGEHRPVLPGRGSQQRPQVRGPQERKVSGQHRDQARVPGVTEGGQFRQPAAQRGHRACAGWFLPDDARRGRFTRARPAERGPPPARPPPGSPPPGPPPAGPPGRSGPTTMTGRAPAPVPAASTAASSVRPPTIRPGLSAPPSRAARPPARTIMPNGTVSGTGPAESVPAEQRFGTPVSRSPSGTGGPPRPRAAPAELTHRWPTWAGRAAGMSGR